MGSTPDIETAVLRGSTTLDHIEEEDQQAISGNSTIIRNSGLNKYKKKSKRRRAIGGPSEGLPTPQN